MGSVGFGIGLHNNPQYSLSLLVSKYSLSARLLVGELFDHRF